VIVLRELTLEELGNAYSLSTEPIRQIEEKALRVLEDVLIAQHYAGKNYHVHPLVPQIADAMRDIIDKEPSGLILETRLLECVHQRLNIDPEKPKSCLLLLLSLIGGRRIFLYYPNAIPIWGYIERGQRKVLESRIKRLDDFLTRETILPQFEIDIRVRLNRRVKKSEQAMPAELTWLIDLCSTVERREDGSVWGKFECLKGRGNQVERILVEAGEPQSLAKIVRTTNHRLVPLGQGRVTERNISNLLIGDDRFVSQGRSGQWGLQSWSHIDTKSILTLMEDCLIILNKPATVDEIFRYVSERRPVSKNSIQRYLSEKEAFARIGRTTWGLAKWSDVTDKDIWNKEQVADFIASVFKSNKAKELSYKVLKEALMEKAAISAKQAQGLLNRNPVIKTRSAASWDSERIAVFQPNYKAVLADAKIPSSGKKVSLKQQVEERVHDILEAAPDKQMAMPELMKLLQTQLGSPLRTVYNYVLDMNSIERLEVPGSRTRVCRLKDSHNAAAKGDLRHRINESVRNILETTPNKEMSLSEIIVRLQRENNCPKATLYQYIANLDYIERLNIPNTQKKICRMKEIKDEAAFPQAYSIATESLRQSVIRAISMLNETEVDLGLFSLSRDFENTLKAYLIAAGARGKFQIPTQEPPNRWRLANMIDWALKGGIITDSAALNYLRQERNSRAHGGTPSLAERQLIMGSVQYTAGMCIGYIKLLDDLIQNL